ncbi:unnamed protein product [Closterium sp. NIES-65]|nr:unnamed protein product [Closterium sp. NIES-65]
MDSRRTIKQSTLLPMQLLSILFFLLLTLSQFRADELPGTCAVAGECDANGDNAAEAAATTEKDANRSNVDGLSGEDVEARADPYALLADGHAKLKARNYEEAIDSYNKLDAVLSRLYGSMLHGRGVARSMLKQHQQAALDLKQAVEKQPHKANYWVELGQEYTLLNDYSNAHSAFVKAVELDPHNDRARQFRGMSAFEIEHYAAALEDLVPALTRDPTNTQLLTQVGLSLLRLNRYRESQPFWEAAVQADPGEARPGEEHPGEESSGEARPGEAHLGEAHPEEGEAWVQKGITHRILGEGDKAVDSLLMALSVQENIDAYRNLVATRRYQGDHWSAIEWCNKGLAFHPEDSEVLGAIEWCNKGLAFRPEDEELLYVRASMHHALGDHATALSFYDHLLATATEKHMTFNQAVSYYQVPSTPLLPPAHSLCSPCLCVFPARPCPRIPPAPPCPRIPPARRPREVLLYTVARLDRPFSAFQIDNDMDVDFKWPMLHLPFSAFQIEDDMDVGFKWPMLHQPFSAFQIDDDMDVDFKLLPQLSEAALAVIAAADEIGWRAHYDTDGVMPNKQQLRMAGLAALDVMQQVRATWEAIADGGRLPSIVEDDDEEGEEGEGAKEGRAGEEEEGEGEWDKLTSPPRMPLKRFSGSGGSGGSSGAESVQLVGSWRQLFQVMVPWRQLSDPTEPPLWKAMFKNQRFQGSFHSHTPIHMWKQFSSKYNAIYDRAVEVTRRGLLEGQQALDEDGNVIPVPRDVYGPKIEAAKGHEGLYHAIGRDFYLRLPLHSMAKPGPHCPMLSPSLLPTLHPPFRPATLLYPIHPVVPTPSLQSRPPFCPTILLVPLLRALSIDFQTYTKNSATQWGQLDDELTAAWELDDELTSAWEVSVTVTVTGGGACAAGTGAGACAAGMVFQTYTKNSATQWGQLDDELTAAWESLSAAVLDLPTRATDSSLYQQRIRENILRISYYWFQLMPLSRGSAMVGLVSILGLSMAADMETTARIPRDVLVDWEGLFATRFQDFYDAVAPWLYSSVKRSPWHLPIVREALPTTRHVLAALSYK